MDFPASLAYLDQLGAELHVGRKFDLAHMRLLLVALDHPEARLTTAGKGPPLAVHIAGTNGKGSIASMVEAAARAAGWRTGLYTSPHLERVTERIRLAGEEIPAADFARLATRVRETSAALVAAGRLPHPPSYFEVLTAIGFLAMGEGPVDLAVVEVGLGGRLDATNALSADVAVIGPIGLDHQDYLGRTLTAIAGEKAGIIKPGVSAAVVAPQPPEVRDVLLHRGRDTQVPLLWAPESGPTRAGAGGVHPFDFTYAGQSVRLEPALPGRHQVTNAICAAMACAELNRLGLAIPNSALMEGIGNVRWPGRLERMPAPRGYAGEVWLDGAHNPMGAAALAEFWRDRAAEPSVIVFASLRDKSAAAVAECLLPLADAVVFTAPHQSRALPPEAVARLCAGWARRYETAPDFPTAWEFALRLAENRRPILITGSLYLVGEARGFLLRLAAGAPRHRARELA